MLPCRNSSIQKLAFGVELISLRLQTTKVDLLISRLDLLLFDFCLVVGCKTVSHTSHISSCVKEYALTIANLDETPAQTILFLEEIIRRIARVIACNV